MSAPAWGNDGRSRKPVKPEQTGDRKTGEIGATQLVDMYFDGAISPEARRALEIRIAEDGALRREVRATRGVIEHLRRPVAAPDMTDEILRRVSEVHGFASAVTRRRVWGARLAFAASLVGLLGTVVAIRAVYPHAPAGPGGHESQESRVVRGAAADGMQTLSTAVDSLGWQGTETIKAPRLRPRRPSLEMDGISKYEAAQKWHVAEVGGSGGSGASPGAVALFLPDAGRTTIESPTSLAGVIPDVEPDPAVRLRDVDAVLKLDRPWWLWTVEKDRGEHSAGAMR